MDESYGSFASTRLPLSVPAVIVEDKRTTANGNAAKFGSSQSFPPASNGYQAPGTRYHEIEQTDSSWKGFFNISSYIPYFNVDAENVVERIISSVYPMDDFFRKTEGNPDLYGPVWISTTLVILLASFGNCAAYLLHKRNDASLAWTFDVNYINRAACLIYGYTVLVPAAFYLMYQYLGSPANIFRLWCMWGYSLSIFLPTSLLLVVPSEFFRWMIAIFVGAASSYFIALNLDAETRENDLMVLSVSASILHFALAICIQVLFYT